MLIATMYYAENKNPTIYKRKKRQGARERAKKKRRKTY